MDQPERNPFEPPSSEIRSDRPLLDRTMFERARVRTWTLIGLLSVQLVLELVALVSSVAIGIWAALFVLVIRVAPPAAAIACLRKKSPNGIALVMVSAVIFGSLNRGTSPIHIVAQLFEFTMMVIALSILWSHGVFRRRRPPAA
jgi:uncharacterized membrane protein